MVAILVISLPIGTMTESASPLLVETVLADDKKEEDGDKEEKEEKTESSGSRYANTPELEKKQQEEARSVKYSGESTDVTEPKVINGVLLVNKQNPIPPSYAPKKLVDIQGEKGDADAVSALQGLLKEANAVSGHKPLTVTSGYRSYEYQKTIFRNDDVSMRPGFSEHQTGLAFDLTTSDYKDLTQKMIESKEFQWLEENVHKHGFIIRYEYGQESVTGIQYEPWHIRYIGKEKAKEYKEKGSRSLEAFLGEATDVDVGGDGEGGTEGDGSDNEATGNEHEKSDYERFDPFIKQETKVERRGTVEDENSAPFLSYLFMSTGDKVVKALDIIALVFSAGLIMLLGLQVFVLASYNKTGSAGVNEKIKGIVLGKSDPTQLKKRIFINFFIVTIVMSLSMLGFGTVIQGILYRLLGDLVL